jgi:hypothetical protein
LFTVKDALIIRIFILIHLLLAAAVAAQDGLYAPVLPGDTSYIRLLNAAGNGEALSVDVGTARIGPLEPFSGSDYHAVRPGVYVIFAGGNREPITARPASFYTVLVTPERIVVREDIHHEDALRSQFIVYNVSDLAVRVDAIVPQAPLFESVSPGLSQSVTINAIPVTIRVSADGQDGRSFFDMDLVLTRGDSYAVVATGTGDDLSGFLVKAGVDRPRR